MSINRHVSNVVSSVTRNRLPMLALLLLAALASSASAQRIAYKVTAKTGDGYWDGTWMRPQIRMRGESGTWTAWKELKGDFGPAGSEATTNIMSTNVGVIDRIELYVGETAAADVSPGWVPESVTVQTPHEPGSIQATTSLFNIGVEIGLRATLPVGPTRITGRPELEITPTGVRRTPTKRVRVAQFARNGRSVEDEVFKFTERFEFVQEFGVSTVQGDETQNELRINYTSPETVAGQFGAEAARSWSKTFSTEKSQHTANLNGSEFNWAFNTAPYTYVLRIVEWEIPEEYTLFEDENGQKRWIRKLGSPIGRPTWEDSVEIGPNVLPQNKPTWSEIEAYLNYLDESQRTRVLNLKATWLAQGYLKDSTQSTQPQGTQPQGTQPQGTQPQASISLPIDTALRLRAFYGQNYYVRPMSDGVKIGPGDGQDAVFIVRRGLNGEGVSLESKQNPGYFLRHAYFKVTVGRNDHSAGFARDATFHVRTGLNGREQSFSLEAITNPGCFLRHSNSVVKLEQNDNSDGFAGAASFQAIAPPPQQPSGNQPQGSQPQPTQPQNTQPQNTQPQGSQPQLHVEPAVTSTYLMTARIRCVGNERTLHVDSDNLVSTKSDANDDRAVFDIEKCDDGSYRFKSKSNGSYLWVYDTASGDQLLSTRAASGTDEYTKFIFEQQSDGSYRIKLKKTGRYLHVDGGGDKLASTRADDNDAFTRFHLLSP